MNRWYTGVWVSKNTTFPTNFGCEAFFKEYCSVCVCVCYKSDVKYIYHTTTLKQLVPF